MDGCPKRRLAGACSKPVFDSLPSDRPCKDFSDIAGYREGSLTRPLGTFDALVREVFP